jgi:hypothetical protein
VKAGCGKTARPVWAADGGQPGQPGASSDPTAMKWGKAWRPTPRSEGGPC